MPNMGMPNQYPNQMPNMGMPNQYPNQMPMGIPNQQINININNEQKKSSKNKILAAILAFFLGGFGIHKFYLGKPGWGLLYLLAFWTGIPYFIALIESIMYLCTSDDDWNRKY
ncbi:TM2 domain-containing protein [bacterium]|nr:TM2 domain-containing protein [bacterium]